MPDPRATRDRPAEGERCLAIISEVGFGMRDLSEPVLWWTVHTDESWAALHVFPVAQAVEIIKAYGVRDVKDLDGRPVWVRRGDGRITFDRPWRKKNGR